MTELVAALGAGRARLPPDGGRIEENAVELDFENVVRPKIRALWTKRETPENLWVKCPETGEMVFHKDLEANQFVFPGSGYHQRIDARTRFRLFFDDGDLGARCRSPQVPLDPLRFRDERRYTERLKAAKAKTGLDDAVMLGAGNVEGVPLVAAVQDFDFMGGSLGMAAAEAIITGAEAAVRARISPTSSSPARAARACRRASSR